MTLHDRIINIDVTASRKRADVRAEAAEIAKEADELMAEMAEAMLEYDTMACRDEFGDILQKYWSWKERTK